MQTSSATSSTSSSSTHEGRFAVLQCLTQTYAATVGYEVTDEMFDAACARSSGNVEEREEAARELKESVRRAYLNLSLPIETRRRYVDMLFQCVS